MRFSQEVSVGDDVITYAPEVRSYYFGRVTSPCRHDPNLIEGHPHVHDVQWTGQARRDDLSLATRNTLGSVMTLFLVNEDAAADVRANVTPIDDTNAAPTAPTPSSRRTAPSDDDEEATAGDLLEETVQKAADFVADRIGRLTWEEMEHLVAGVLHSMGYRTKVSAPGADRGFDVFASPDGLGLQDPRIFVEVKHRKGSMGAPAIRSFLGGRQTGDRCLYVSTGGFTKDARYEADRANVPVRLLNLTDLAELVVDRYEDLDDQTRNMVPLRRIYWPMD